jgi:3-oxoacyl-[acyl-carrier protein] reductase
MKINLAGKFALITGSSEGIGFHIAKTLQENGCKVVINGRNKSKLNSASKKLQNCFAIKGDVSNYKQANKIITNYKKHFKQLDILVCNVGNGKKINEIADIDEWHKSFNENFWSTINVIKSAEKILIKSKSSIICISSICGLEHISGAPIPYSVAKSALNSFVVNQSNFFANFKTRINAIAPGNIIFQGSTWSKKMKKSPVKTKNYINQNVPLKLFGKPDDVSNMVLYLCSDKTKYITGSIFKIDGGQVRSW